MKKVILSIVALLSSAFTFAQVAAGSFKAEVNPSSAATAAAKKAAPAKADLAANQRLMGWYTTDDLAANGIGIPTFGAQDDVRAVTTLTPDMLEPFVGKKVVGIRYGVMVDNMVNSVLLGEISSNGSFGEPLTAEAVSSSATGWNTQMFSTPYTIKANTEIYAGYSFKQKATKSGSNYTNDCFPMSLVQTGISGQTLYLYTSIPASYGGSGEKEWGNFGNTNGNLSVQLIIEGDYQGQFLMPASMADIQTAVGHDYVATMVAENVGAQPISKFSYTITQNGVASEEKTMTLDTPESATIAELPVIIPGATATGKYPMTVTVTKVNDEQNLASTKDVNFNNEVKAKLFKPTVVMEEFTGTTCQFCPRGMVGMEKIAKALGDQFVGIAIHQYSASDPMYTINYANLGFTGAPQCKLNRKTKGIDPFTGSNLSIVDDALSIINEGIPDAAVTSIDAQWSTEAQDSVLIKATFEAQEAKTYQTAYVLTADDVKGEGSAWGQINAFSKNRGIFTYAQLADDLKFLWDEPVTYYPSYPDVLIGSSYVRTINKADNVNIPAEGAASGQYNVGLPLSTNKVMEGVDKTKLNAIVLIIDPTTRYIVNAAKTSDIKAWTAGISSVNGNGAAQAKEVARYTVGGQKISAPVKGINIVKMSDGTTRKVFVAE